MTVLSCQRWSGLHGLGCLSRRTSDRGSQSFVVRTPRQLVSPLARLVFDIQSEGVNAFTRGTPDPTHLLKREGLPEGNTVPAVHSKPWQSDVLTTTSPTFTQLHWSLNTTLRPVYTDVLSEDPVSSPPRYLNPGLWPALRTHTPDSDDPVQSDSKPRGPERRKSRVEGLCLRVGLTSVLVTPETSRSTQDGVLRQVKTEF